MKFITIVTPANIEVEYRLAGAGSRAGAFLIDFALQIIVWLLFLWASVRVFETFFTEVSSADDVFVAMLIIVSFVIFSGYFIICELLMRGQTVGKRILGLRAIRDNGQPVTFARSIIRGLLRSSIDMVYAGIIVIIFSKQHKRIGDMAAGTVVISEKYKSELSILTKSEPWPENFPDPLILTETERNFIHEFLRRRESLPDRGAKIHSELQKYLEKGEKWQQILDYTAADGEQNFS